MMASVQQRITLPLSLGLQLESNNFDQDSRSGFPSKKLDDDEFGSSDGRLAVAIIPQRDRLISKDKTILRQLTQLLCLDDKMQQLGITIEDQPLRTSIQPQTEFIFPRDCHLLITTSSHIYAWNHSSIDTLFKSSKNGIVAAREAPNGSGVLAVADKHVLVLHDTKRGQEKSWGLGADKDEVRQLEYTADARSLYLSTSLTPDIQRYSTELSRLLDPARAHASPPVALAISPTGRLMVSASDSPPVVYLRNVECNGSPVLIEPRASRAAVAVAAFHPERSNIFLLAFRDGAVAIYDATRILRSGSGSISNQESVNNGEICHLTSLHRAASCGRKSGAITDAAFLPGFKWRAVTVGNDGRCRIVDFANGGVILRTWHAKTLVTSVSVIAIKPDVDSRKRDSSNTPAHVIGGPTSTDSLIAIGRADGEVLIYDTVGLLLSQRQVSDAGNRIISVEWIKAPSPRPVTPTNVIMAMGEAWKPASSNDNQTDTAVLSAVAQDNAKPTSRQKAIQRSTESSSKLRRAKQTSQERGTTPQDPPRKLTIHPDEAEDEDEDGTVRRTPVRDAHKIQRISTRDFKDLFSSPKVDNDESNIDKSPARIASPPRVRPTITSQTFVKSPEPRDSTQYDIMARRRNLALFPSTDSKPETADPSQSTSGHDAHCSVSVPRLSKPIKRATFRVNSIQSTYGRTGFKSGSFRSSQNMKQPSSLPVLKPSGSSNAPQGVLCTEPAFIRPNSGQKHSAVSVWKKGRMQFLHRKVDHVETDADSETALEAYEHIHKRYKWPEDSNQESSASNNGCVTSSLRRKTPIRVSQTKSIERPPARQTSRSKMNSHGLTSTTDRRPAQGATPGSQPVHRIDGSTEEEEDIFITADTHLTSSGTFSPASKDVYALFPRSSSLSPQKDSHQTPHKRRSPASRNHPRKNPAPRQSIQTHSKSPWTRAKVLRNRENGADQPSNMAEARRDKLYSEQWSTTDGQTEGLTDAHCSDCHATYARVLALEAEVTRLRGEILDVKARLKRHVSHR